MKRFLPALHSMAALLLISPMAFADAIYGPALIGPHFSEQPWLGQPGYDNPGPAVPNKTQQKITHGLLADKPAPAEGTTPTTNNTPTTPDANAQPGQTPPANDTQTNPNASANPQQTSDANTTVIQQPGRILTRPGTNYTTTERFFPRNSYQFGTQRNAPQFSPGNAQLYDQLATGFGPKENYNVQRYKEIPRNLCSNPSWQNGHFLTKPKDMKAK